MKSNTAIVCLSPYAGGMEFDAVRLFKLLCAEADIFLVVRKGVFLENLAKREIPADRIRPISFRANFGPSLVFGFRQVLVEQNIRNVIYFGASELVSLFFGGLRLKLNFIVRHGTTKSHSKKDPYHNLIYSNVNWHVAVSDHILKNVQQICPIAKGAQLKRIYLSRDIPQVRAERQDGKITIIHIGRVHPGKGQADAIVALQQLKSKNLDFEANFLGNIDDQRYYQDIERQVRDYQLTDRVHFRGHVEDVFRYLKKADILLFPSHGEGLPNALIEGMALGLVPITYDNTVFPEIRQLGCHILLAEDRNTGMLSDLLCDAAENLPAHLEKSKMNIEKYKRYFSPQVERENYLRVLV